MHFKVWKFLLNSNLLFFCLFVYLCRIGRKDIDVFVDYVKFKSPIDIGIEGRITVYEK